MIIVVADDFTGASEMAGIALEFGLTVRIQTVWNFIIEPCEVLVIDTNTRSLGSLYAAAVTDRVMNLVESASPEMLFKKTDSVLRGNVKEELESVLKCNAGKSVLLVPANPSMGRTIHKGMYHVDGRPIHTSIFSRDPEFPARYSDVVHLIDKKVTGNPVRLVSPGQALEPGTIHVPFDVGEDDVQYWAGQLLRDSNLIAAGAADFFRAVLHETGRRPVSLETRHYDFGGNRSLIVCGSSLSDISTIRSRMISNQNDLVEISIPDCPDMSDHFMDGVAGNVVGCFNKQKNVVLTLGSSNPPKDSIIRELPTCLARIVSTILRAADVRELIIEGGTTSSEIVRKMGWNCFEPTHVIAEGIIRMNIPQAELHLTVKPGSYPWPEEMWLPQLSEYKLPKTQN